MTASIPDTSAWEAFYRRLRRCSAPQRPPAEINAIIQAAIGPQSGTALLLGTTPELSAVSSSVIAVDWSASAIAFIWPGCGPGRRAIQGDWLKLPCAAGTFSSAVGDGSLSCLEYPDGYRRLFDELARVVRPGGRVALRIFATPVDCESLSHTREVAMAGGVQTASGLKWRIATALCAERRDPNLAVREIHVAFDRLFPDRAALARVTRWTEDDIAGFDVLDEVRGTYSFPTVAEVLRVVPPAFRPSFGSSGCYELSDRCPLLILDVCR